MLVDGLDFAAYKGDYREMPRGLDGLCKRGMVACGRVPRPAAVQCVLRRGFPGDDRQRGAKHPRHLLPQLLGHTERERTAGKHIPYRVQVRSFGETEFGFDQFAGPPKRRGRRAVSDHLEPVMPSPFAQSAQPLKSFGGEFHEHLRRGRDLLDSHNVS